MSDRSWIWYGLIIALALGAAALLEDHVAFGIEQSRHAYTIHAHEEALTVSHRVEEALGAIYQGLRTIARLPGVQSIDRYGNDIGADARRTVQEVYNNLANNVDMSEVYIVPATFDHERIDPRTGKYEETIITFDEFIVGRTRTSKNKGRGIEEVEEFEYQVMREQIEWFKANHASAGSISGLDYPALGAREVVTCDNRRFSPESPDDAHRSGLVYSVPFYGPEGSFRGLVTGVILSLVLGELLPNAHYALRHANYDYTIPGPGSGQSESSHAWVERIEADPELIYSSVLAVHSADAHGGWRLWVGRPNSQWETLPEVRAQQRFAMLGYSGIVLLAALTLTYVGTARRNAARLEARVRERTAQLAAANCALRQAHLRESQFTGNAAHELRTPLAAILALAHALARSGEDGKARAGILANLEIAAKRAARLVDQLLTLARVDPDEQRTDISVRAVDLTELAQNTLATLHTQAAAKEIQIALEAPPEPVSVHGNDLALETALRNLVENAIHYTGRGGNLIVTITANDPSGGGAVLAVADDGPGIPPEHRGRVLERFYRVPGNRQSGAGLGLSIVARIAALHGASVVIEDNRPHGTVVSVHFRSS